VTFPALTLGFILATLYGTTFHLIAGGDARRLAVYLIASWAGFAAGQMLGAVLGIDLFNIGTLHLLTATVAAALALVGAMLLMRRRRLFV
jgi:hypothetical protein